jgi:hypothetical protein
VIKAFQDSIDRHPPGYMTLDWLRAITLPKPSSYHYDRPPLNPINNAIITDNQQQPSPTMEDAQL